MSGQDVALAAAGAIGMFTAIVHGVLVERLMSAPFERFAAADPRVGATVRRLVPILLHMSTVFWFVGGVALVAIALGFAPDFRLAASVFVGSTFLFGAAGNLWGTRGFHPGWILLTLALILIVIGNTSPT